MSGFRSALTVCALALGLASCTVQAQEANGQFAGLYDGGQMEIAAQLELGRDGRYRYALSYGALDEWSAGTWTAEGGAIVLASDPFKAPAFEVSDAAGQPGRVSVTLDLPEGIDPQYFGVSVHRADGSATFVGMTADPLVIPIEGNPVVSVRPVLAVFNLLGPVIPVPAKGAALRISFQPNDLGFAGFAKERLRHDGEAFEMERHGRTLRFRKVR